MYITDNAISVKDNPREPLYITEGEKKALAVSQHGLPCIGISGLWNWKNKGCDDLIEDFNLFSLDSRTVYLIPDNDYRDTKHHGWLNYAVNKLAVALGARGANVYLIELPEGNTKGVDDFLCSSPIDELLKLKENARRLISSREKQNKDFQFMTNTERKEYLQQAQPPLYLGTGSNDTFYFQETLAIKVGVKNAIVLQKIHNWIVYNFEKSPETMIKDGRTWCFRGYEYLQRELPFLSKITIIRAIKLLEKLEILISRNFNSRPGNKTKWYSINYDRLKEYIGE